MYAYVDNNPLGFSDPFGLVKVTKNISETLVNGDIDRSCESMPAGACTVGIRAAASAVCEGCGDGYRAKAYLFVYGQLFAYDGPFPYKNRRPRDTSVVSTATAVAHECREHLDPATNAAVAVLAQLEGKQCGSKEECEQEKTKYIKRAIKAFYSVLRSTKGY